MGRFAVKSRSRQAALARPISFRLASTLRSFNNRANCAKIASEQIVRKAFNGLNGVWQNVGSSPIQSRL